MKVNVILYVYKLVKKLTYMFTNSNFKQSFSMALMHISY